MCLSNRRPSPPSAAHDLSIDEGIDSDEDSDNEHYDSESDNGESHHSPFRKTHETLYPRGYFFKLTKN